MYVFSCVPVSCPDSLPFIFHLFLSIRLSIYLLICLIIQKLPPLSQLIRHYLLSLSFSLLPFLLPAFSFSPHTFLPLRTSSLFPALYPFSPYCFSFASFLHPLVPLSPFSLFHPFLHISFSLFLFLFLLFPLFFCFILLSLFVFSFLHSFILSAFPFSLFSYLSCLPPLSHVFPSVHTSQPSTLHLFASFTFPSFPPPPLVTFSLHFPSHNFAFPFLHISHLPTLQLLVSSTLSPSFPPSLSSPSPYKSPS